MVRAKALFALGMQTGSSMKPRSSPDVIRPLAVPSGVGPRLFILLAWLCFLATPALAEGIRTDGILEIRDTDQSVIVRLQVEVADTPAVRERGLMWRVLPDDDRGLLFIYPEAAPRAFWMRNTPASLDMLFAGADGHIFHIAEETPPNSDQLHLSRGPAMYVLETRGGFAARQGVAPGMSLAYFSLPATPANRR